MVWRCGPLPRCDPPYDAYCVCRFCCQSCNTARGVSTIPVMAGATDVRMRRRQFVCVAAGVWSALPIAGLPAGQIVRPQTRSRGALGSLAPAIGRLRGSVEFRPHRLGPAAPQIAASTVRRGDLAAPHPLDGLAITVQLDTREPHHSNVPATTAHNRLVMRMAARTGRRRWPIPSTRSLKL